MANWSTETRKQIRAFVSIHFPGAASLDDAESLLDSGIVDSVGILDLVAFLEEQFGVTVTDDDLLADHFESIASLAALVWAKGGNEGQAPAA